jgi:hypothetical protein
MCVCVCVCVCMYICACKPSSPSESVALSSPECAGGVPVPPSGSRRRCVANALPVIFVRYSVYLRGGCRCLRRGLGGGASLTLCLLYLLGTQFTCGGGAGASVGV